MSQNICQKYDICFSLQFTQDVSLMEESEVFQLFGGFFFMFLFVCFCVCVVFWFLLLVCVFLGVLGVFFWFFWGEGWVGWLVRVFFQSIERIIYNMNLFLDYF